MLEEIKKIAVTDDHFEIFKDEVNHWLDFFGMKDWEVCFTLKESENHRAQVWFNVSGRIATFVLIKEWHEEILGNITNEDIRIVAFHEVCELLLGPIRDIAMSRASFEVDCTTEIHRVIRILENTLYKKIKE